MKRLLIVAFVFVMVGLVVSQSVNISGGSGGGDVTTSQLADSTAAIRGDMLSASAITDSLDAYRSGSKLDTTKIDTSQFGKFTRDHQSSGLSTNAITDSLNPYRTAFKWDTAKIDTSQWGNFIRDHQSSGGGDGGILADPV